MGRHWSSWGVFALVAPAALLAPACPSREIPPPPEPAPVVEPPSRCGPVFRDPKVRGGSGCCWGPSDGLLKPADVVATCGLPAGAYVGQTRDGEACRLHFKVGDNDPKDSMVMINRPVIPPGAPAPTGPSRMLPWSWRKVELRDGIGFEATKASDDARLLEHQNILWAGRGRRIVGLNVAKQVCTDEQAHVLLQKALDAVP